MKMHTRTDIDASAADAWEILGARFGTISRWTQAIEHSFLEGILGVGAVRTCETARFGPVPGAVMKERLIAFDPVLHSFEYTVDERLPGFFIKAHNRWTIKATGSGCQVHSHARFQLIWWARPWSFLLRWMLRGSARKFGEELRQAVLQVDMEGNNGIERIR